MGVHKTPIQFPNGSGSMKDKTTESTFGNQATGLTTEFGRQTNTVFGTFANQNNQQQQQQQSTNNNNSAVFGFGSRNIFGNNFFRNPGYFPQHNFGFGRTMLHHTTNICFTGLGEPKTNYCFTNSIATMKKVTLVFEHPDTIVGSCMPSKLDTIIEIETHPINSRSWASSYDFSFSVDQIEKYNSIFIMKSASPIKLFVTVKQAGIGFNNRRPSSINFGKITLTFQSDQTQYIPNRPFETIVEVPLPFPKYDPFSTISNENFKFAVGPTGANNTFEVQTSKNAVFKISFAETGKYNNINNQLFGNRQTSTGSVFFDQGRQINPFPVTSGSLFGQTSSAAFGANQSFGNSATGNNHGGQSINGSLFAKSSENNEFGGTLGFGTNKSFNNISTTCTAGSGAEKLDKGRSNTGGFIFGQKHKLINSKQTNEGTSSVFGQLIDLNTIPPSGVYYDQHLVDFKTSPTTFNQQSFDSSHNNSCAFGANQTFTNPKRTSVQDNMKKDLTSSVHYQPTLVTDVFSNDIQNKMNCITAMNEYSNKSLEELRIRDYSLNSSCESSTENNIITDPGKLEETANSNANTFTGQFTSPTRNAMIGNTNQAFFDQLHQLIPYLNAGSFCKCIRSCNAAAPKNQNNNSVLANSNSSQKRTNSDSIDHLYVNTQKSRLNDNMTLDEFYEDVFKYLEHIQKQYRHLESTLNNKNGNNLPDDHSNKSETHKEAEESNTTSNPNIQKAPMPAFGCSTFSIVNTSLNENSLSGSENDAATDEKVPCILDNAEPKKSLLFGTSGGVSSNNELSTSKPLEADVTEKSLSRGPFRFSIISQGNSDDVANKNDTNKTEEQSKESEILKTKESNKNSSKTFPMPLFGNSTFSIVNTNLNENSSSGSANDAATDEKVPCSLDNAEPKKNLLFGTGGGVSSNDELSTSKPLEADVTAKSFSRGPFRFSIISQGNSDDVANKNDTNKTEEQSKESEILKTEESNKNSSRTFPMPLFGCSTYSAPNDKLNESNLLVSSINPFSENAASAAKKDSSIFGPSPFIAAADGTVTACSTTGNTTNDNNNVEPTKSSFVGTSVDSKIDLGAFKPLDFSFGIKSAKSDDAVKMKETNKTLGDQSNDIRTSMTIGEKTTGISSSTAPSSMLTGYILPTKVTSSSSSSVLPQQNSKISYPSFFSSKPDTTPIFSTKNTTSSSTVEKKSTSIFIIPRGSITSGNNLIKHFRPIRRCKILDNKLTAPVLPTTDTTTSSCSSTVGEKSTGVSSLTLTSRKPGYTFKEPLCSTKDTKSSSTVVEERSSSLFSLTAPSQMATKDTSSSLTVDDKPTGFFSFNIPSSKPDIMFNVPIFTTSSSTKIDNNLPGLYSVIAPINKSTNSEMNANTINVAESNANDSSAKEICQNESDNEGSSGGGNIIKSDTSFKSFISNDSKTYAGSSEENISSNQQKDEPMDVQGGFGTSQVFKMKKISDILADINERELKDCDDTDSDISNYSLISNGFSNEDGKVKPSYIQAEVHPAGIVMTQYGYYTIPSLKDLKSYITEDGACIVPNFTIGRRGYGSVYFNKEINVAGLNIDNIVHFRNKEIIIFPNEEDTNPQVLADLKKYDVLVTLEQVWPHNETKHEPIKYPHHLDKIKYDDKLRLVCHKNDVHFVDYRPENGCWLFKMKQFTKSNINCWDVEDVDERGIPKIMLN